MVVEMRDEYEVKIKIELINDGFLVYSPTGVQFRENLIDAVDLGVDELEQWSTENFRVPFCEEDTEELKKRIELKKRVLASQLAEDKADKAAEKVDWNKIDKEADAAEKKWNL
jgi:hypothetical protein